MKSIGVITFDLSDLGWSMSRSLRFLKLKSHNGAESGHRPMLLLDKETIYGGSNDAIKFYDK